MATYTNATPSWLASERFLSVTKTINATVCTNTVTQYDADGLAHTVCVSGGLYYDSTSGVYGILLNDVDITTGNKIGAVVVNGTYYDNKLPSTLASYASNLSATGLFAVVDTGITRPNFGATGLTKLAFAEGGTPSANKAVISWTKVANADEYAVSYGGAVVATVAQSDSPSYTATSTGDYKIVAVGDNLYYASSDPASVTVTELS